LAAAGIATHSDAPQRLASLRHVHVVSVNATISHSCAVTNTGDLYVWGDSQVWQTAPRRVPSVKAVTAVACGEDYIACLVSPTLPSPPELRPRKLYDWEVEELDECGWEEASVGKMESSVAEDVDSYAPGCGGTTYDDTRARRGGGDGSGETKSSGEEGEELNDDSDDEDSGETGDGKEEGGDTVPLIYPTDALKAGVVPSLLSICTRQAAANVNPRNIGYYLAYAVQFGIMELIDFCHAYIEKNFDAVLSMSRQSDFPMLLESVRMLKMFVREPSAVAGGLLGFAGECVPFDEAKSDVSSGAQRLPKAAAAAVRRPPTAHMLRLMMKKKRGLKKRLGQIEVLESSAGGGGFGVGGGARLSGEQLTKMQRKDSLVEELTELESLLALHPDLVKAQEVEWRKGKESHATSGASGDESKKGGGGESAGKDKENSPSACALLSVAAEVYCEVCKVSVADADTMATHVEGKRHMKRVAKQKRAQQATGTAALPVAKSPGCSPSQRRRDRTKTVSDSVTCGDKSPVPAWGVTPTRVKHAKHGGDECLLGGVATPYRIPASPVAHSAPAYQARVTPTR
jgi:hypothetical protein